MARVVVSAQVQDPVAWEKGYRTRGALLQQGGTNKAHYTIADNNWIVIYMKVKDLDAFNEFMASDAVVAAMAEDGVKAETVRVHALDRRLSV